MIAPFRSVAIWSSNHSTSRFAHGIGAITLVCLAAIGLPASPNKASSAERSSKPNVIVILADDLGRGDYSAFGTTDLRTPNVDRLFREGTSCEDFFANSCVCSPTRASLLSGCVPDRVGVPGVIRDVPQNSWGCLAPGAVLLPKRLKPAGYHTAIVGKWHLGYELAEHAQRPRVRLLSRLSRRHDGRLLHPSAPRP